MESGTLDNALNPWGVAVFRSLRETEPRTPSEQAAFSKYLDQRSDREDARSDRTHGGEGVIPTPLWIVLFLSAAILFVFAAHVAWEAAATIAIGSILGAQLGAKVGRRIPDEGLRWTVVIGGTIVAIILFLI